MQCHQFSKMNTKHLNVFKHHLHVFGTGVIFFHSNFESMNMNPEHIHQNSFTNDLHNLFCSCFMIQTQCVLKQYMKLFRIAGAYRKIMLLEEIKIEYIIFNIQFDTMQVQSLTRRSNFYSQRCLFLVLRACKPVNTKTC